MKLKGEIIERIYGYDVQHNSEIKKELSRILRRNANSICNYLRENRENGDLTKLEVLNVISAKLNLPIKDITAT